jgi:C-terminal processing protease CtpA/Prc
MNTVLASLVVGLGLFAAPDTRDRPFVDVRINDPPVHLTIDTGDLGGVEVSSELVATVLESGPAYEAGIRDGDRLLRVNGRDITGWRNDPNGMPEGLSAFAQAAGTKLHLTILREGQSADVTLVLQELLPVEMDSVFPSTN